MNTKGIMDGLTSSGRIDLNKTHGKEKALYKAAYKAHRTAQYKRMNTRELTESEKAIISRKDEIRALHEVR